MCNVVGDYFSNIFAKPDSMNNSEVEASPRLVTEAQNEKLTEEVTFEEFTLAVNQMHPDKASGPDGLNPAFYQSFWKIMGKEVFECCKKWLRGDPFPADLNSTNVVLIPKKDNAATMRDFRPIALCNVLYKIMAKVLANRLKEILPGIIAENQSAFVAGRNITDNFLVAFEVIHHMRNKKRGQDGEIALKLDVSKAYDRVDWSYLHQRMVAMGFCEGWIKWMMRCVTTVGYEFCFNGMTVGPIVPGRGLRQGDPLSPYLFLFCVEGLSIALDNTAARGEIHGCRISTSAPEITHLLFADDSFLFFKAEVSEVLKIKSILEEYAVKSGQSINFQKSGIFYSSNVRREKQVEFSEILGVSNDISSSNYLGLPALIGRSKKRMFGFLKEKVSRKLQAWCAKPISRAGKTVLLKNAAQSIPSYCMTCFLLPISLCQEIERLFNEYWWKSGNGQRRGVHWHSWESMSMSKGKGGLGFRSLYGFNIALLGKQVWRCMSRPNLLVSRVLKARYFSDSSLLHAVKGNNSSTVWGGIWQVKELLKGGYRWVVGNGSDIIATKDHWLRDKNNFCVEDFHGYAGRSECVKSLFIPGTKIWDERKVKQLFMMVDAKAILATRVPHHEVEDRIVWSSSKDGIYTVKAGYNFWHNRNVDSSAIPQSNGWHKVWQLTLPHKVKIFIWRFCRNNLPVRVRLQGKGIPVPTSCPMCNVDIENLRHVFFECSFAMSCWQHVNLLYDTNEMDEANVWLLHKLETASQSEITQVCMVLYGIWFWRNKQVWEGKTVTGKVAVECCSKMVQDWKEARAKGVTEKRVHQSQTNCNLRKWTTPAAGEYKVNVDASWFQGAESFSIGMVIRNHLGSFVEGRTVVLSQAADALEAEVLGIREALSWVKSMDGRKVTVESDSLVAVNAINGQNKFLLEVGHIIDHCRLLLQSLSGVSVKFVRKQANEVAHGLAKMPCSVNCFIIFTSPPTHLVEICTIDAS
ncbi:hypothetical protein AgCh_012338 [Apium graveolens]